MGNPNGFNDAFCRVSLEEREYDESCAEEFPWTPNSEREAHDLLVLNDCIRDRVMSTTQVCNRFFALMEMIPEIPVAGRFVESKADLEHLDAIHQTQIINAAIRLVNTAMQQAMDVQRKGE